VRLPVGRVSYFYLFCNDRGNVKKLKNVPFTPYWKLF